MGYKVCLDAGHYGKYNRSPVVREYYESDFTWKFTLYEKEELEKYGIQVVLTRNIKDNDLALVERGKKSKGCDIFISNHSNACSSETVDHPSVIYPVPYKDTNVERNRQLATLIAENIQRTLGTKEKGKVYSKVESYDRNKNGIKNDDEYYGVLHGAQLVNTPYRLIVEHGFHTNTATAKKLLDDNIIRVLAHKEANAIAVFLGCEQIEIPDVTTPTIVYTVVKGDSLGKIANNFNTTVAEILELNPSIKNANMIYVGQKLNVPSFLEGRVDDVTHIVKKGETLSSIAKLYKTTYIKLALINKIANPSKISVGQVIKLK